MDQRSIDGDTVVQPQITTMLARQQELNTHVNLLVPSKMWYIHHIQDSRPRDVHGPRLGDDLQLLPLHFGQISMWGEHVKDLAVSQIIVTNLQGWNPLQLWSDNAYSLREVRSDDYVVEVPQDTATTHHTEQGWDVVE
jgi:hypothetical protein